MYTDTFKAFTEQAEKTMNPLVKFNQLIAKNVEQISEIQLSAMRAYSNMSVSQIKAAAEINDAATLASFNSQQLSTLAKISEQISDDSKKMQDIAQEFKSELDEILSDNMNTGKNE